MRKRREGPKEVDFKAAWERLIRRFVERYEWTPEKMKNYLLDRSVALLAKAIYHDSKENAR